MSKAFRSSRPNSLPAIDALIITSTQDLTIASAIAIGAFWIVRCNPILKTSLIARWLQRWDLITKITTGCAWSTHLISDLATACFARALQSAVTWVWLQKPTYTSKLRHQNTPKIRRPSEDVKVLVFQPHEIIWIRNNNQTNKWLTTWYTRSSRRRPGRFWVASRSLSWF